jgi:hypothetical protein
MMYMSIVDGNIEKYDNPYFCYAGICCVCQKYDDILILNGDNVINCRISNFILRCADCCEKMLISRPSNLDLMSSIQNRYAKKIELINTELIRYIISDVSVIIVEYFDKFID